MIGAAHCSINARVSRFFRVKRCSSTSYVSGGSISNLFIWRTRVSQLPCDI